MSNLTQWAIRHGVSHVALADLVDMFTGESSVVKVEGVEGSESWVSSQIKLEAARLGVKLTRNNVGALKDVKGRSVRYGLWNESKMMNQRIKSGDFIGIRPILIDVSHIGSTIGQFVMREVKESDWVYTGEGREEAQMRCIQMVNGLGGDACFASGVGTL